MDMFTGGPAKKEKPKGNPKYADFIYPSREAPNPSASYVRHQPHHLASGITGALRGPYRRVLYGRFVLATPPSDIAATCADLGAWQMDLWAPWDKMARVVPIQLWAFCLL